MYEDSPNKVTQREIWRLENELADCYPLPDYHKTLGISLLGEEELAIPHHVNYLAEVPSEVFSLWLTEWAQQKSLNQLLNSNRLSDLRLLYDALEKAHRRLHYLIERAAADGGAVVVGNYLMLSIMHAGVETLIERILAKLRRLNVDKR